MEEDKIYFHTSLREKYVFPLFVKERKFNSPTSFETFNDAILERIL